jgi:hypothetical protein
MNADPAEMERYMIFEGVIQWTQAVALQSDRIAAAQAAWFQPSARPGASRLPGMNFRSECDYFAVAVDMLFQFKKRAAEKDLFASVDFSEIDGLTAQQDRVDIRNANARHRLPARAREKSRCSASSGSRGHGPPNGITS